ncbi:hypothetical protein D3C71_2225980 [compost metagenome]
MQAKLPDVLAELLQQAPAHAKLLQKLHDKALYEAKRVESRLNPPAPSAPAPLAPAPTA